MDLKVFTLRMHPDRGELDDSGLDAYLQGRDVLSVFEHFCILDGQPVWVVMVGTRRLAPTDSVGDVPRPKTDWRAELSEVERGRFDVIRRWRNERAKREGRPPYVFLTNHQIAEIARRSPKAPADLHEIDGIGDSRVRDFGEELVALVSKLQSEQTDGTENDDGT